MTFFGICKPTAKQNASKFISALMNIWLLFGFYHTIVVEKDIKFLGVFAQTSALLNINIDVLSGENYDPIIVERIYRFLNSSLTVFYNDRCNNRVSLEGILMSLYACNSAPVVCTDIYHSLLVTGQKFNFTIDFSIEQHQVLTSNPLEVSTFEVEQARLLECGCVIARELIHHHRAYHFD